MSSLQARAAARTKDKPLDVCAMQMLAIDALMRFGKHTAPTLLDVERTEPAVLRALTTTGTILAPATAALQDAGVPINGTVGDLMTSLKMNEGQLHDAVCNCYNGREMTGHQAANNLKIQFRRR